MAQDPMQPADNGKIGMPGINTSMNKLPPGDNAPAKNTKGGENEDDKQKRNQHAKSKRDEQKILATARKRFKRAVEAEGDNRSMALEDLKFKAGDQWPADIKQQRTNDRRPCLTINTIPTLIHQVTNDLRQNRPAINVSPMGSKADKEGAEAFAGMINAIERDCQADIAYDTGITSAVDIGFGYWRIITEYEHDDTFNQVICVKRIRNAFRVYLDPERQEPDGCDMKWGFITDLISREEFKSTYPNANPMGWSEKGIGDELKHWIQRDFVRVAEYFTVEHEMKRLVQLSTGHTGFYDDLDPSIKQQITDGEVEILNERESEVQKVVWYKITGLEILETRPWLGRWIPIIEVIGEEIDIEGKVIRSGMIRNVKGPAKMKNYWATSKTEMVALAPKAPWVGAEGQFEGHEYEWENAHLKTFAKLEYNPVSLDGHPVPPPMRQGMVGIPEGIVQAEQGSQQDMLATTGVRFDGSVQDSRWDESGRAMKEIRRNVDIGSFHFMDNASRSLRHTGRILVDLIPKIYDVKRVVTILREDDSEERVTLNPQQSQPMQRAPNAKDPAGRKLFNPSVGQYGVTITTGPSYATKRIEAAESMIQFSKVLPQQGQLIAHLIAKYSDWPGSDEAYKILTKALPPNLLAPDPKDLPPQIATFVKSMMTQVAQLGAERMQMLKDLTDQKADRAVRQDKIEKDFEVKMMKVIMDGKAKMLQISREDMMEMAQLHDMTKPQVDPNASGGGIAPGAPVMPQNQPGLPMSPVLQPGG